MTSRPTWHPYCGEAPMPGELLGRWNLDPLLLTGLIILFLAGHLYLARNNPRGAPWFYSAVALLALLFVSPLCALSSALFSARVVHHVLLAAAVAPLLAYSLARASRPGCLSLPFWTVTHALTFWAWHLPNLYAGALSSDATYWLMQVSLLGTAFGFWLAVRSSPAMLAIGALLFAMIQMGLLGALITFAPKPLYAPHLLTTFPWGLSAVEDQQLAGLIMWAPSAGIYLGVALAVAARLLDGERGIAD